MTFNEIKVPKHHGHRARGTRFGSEYFFEKGLDLIRGKKIGFVTNHTAVVSDGRHDVDILREERDVIITALFSPEHGIRGSAPAGAHVQSEVDPETGIQVFSLYGDHTKPDVWMLKNVDILLYDIQDAGARFYTYISTLALCMEAAAENDIPFVILDRPNIVTGKMIGGPMLRDEVKSFIGMLPLPILYTLTPAELSGLIREEYLQPRGLDVDLQVFKMQNYERSMWYDQTGLPWMIPSPNVRTVEAATLYPGIALVEGTNVSEGRGTPFPFQYVGAPFIDRNKLLEVLSALDVPGLHVEPIDFIPAKSSTVSHPRFEGQTCHGVHLRVADRELIKPVDAGLALVCALKKLNSEQLKFRSDGAFDRLSGDKNIRVMIEKGADYREIAATWERELTDFGEHRRRFFLYP